MQKKIEPARRPFLIAATGAGAAAAGLAGCTGASTEDRQLRFASLAAAEDELARLAQARELASSAAWSWPQTLSHCAQSIEFSMSGFPQSKSALFQRTVGSAALGVFSWRGRMTHDLAEPIPGAPALGSETDPAQALQRLHAAIAAFRAWTGPLRPHFAYGALGKQDYELAHAMHVANHLSAFRAKA
eukprot:gene38230-47203_t